MAAQGVGASVRRKEDDRFLRGKGQFVADIRLAGMLEVAFVRSPVAHARILGDRDPGRAPEQRLRGRRPRRREADPRGLRPARASRLRSSRSLAQRQGAPRRRARRDVRRADARRSGGHRRRGLASTYEELPAVVDMLAGARSPARRSCTRTGATTSSSRRLSTTISRRPLDAPISVTRDDPHRAAVHVAARRAAACCANGTSGSGSSRCTARRRCRTSTATGLSECLGLDQGHDPRHRARRRRRLRLQGHPARRGGLPRWLARCAAAARCAGSRTAASSSPPTRTAASTTTTSPRYADRDGRLLGIDCEATVDSGAYSLYPFSACLEAAQVGSILPGPYKMERYRCRTWSVATNKPGILPYRGVARTGVCFALELALDAVAREAGHGAVRGAARKNLVQPRRDAVRQHHQEAFRQRRLSGSGAPRGRGDRRREVRERQKRGEPDGRRIGVGFVDLLRAGRARHVGLSRLGHPDGAGPRAVRARLTPDGVLELRIGAHSHGQSLETTLAQVAHEILGIDSPRSASSTATRRSRPIRPAPGARAAW